MKIRHALIVILAVFICSGMSGAAEILNVRHWAAPDHTRIVIDVDSEPSFQVQESENQLSLTLKEASIRPSLVREILINKPGIKKVIISPPMNGYLKVDLILDGHLKTNVFQLKNFQDKPYRVVVDIFLEEPARGDALKEPPSKTKSDKIIVIDPGHGGEDPGAIGKKGTYEKDVVLSISREIKKAINRIPGYRAVLTRNGDYYVSFNNRLQMAKDVNASLFISVHADAAKNRLAKGSSIYCLSLSGATSEAAKLLAKKENLADIIGGVPNSESKGDSDQIILNMLQTNTINLSKIYANTLINELVNVNTLKHNKAQEAPFRILKLPDIPAVLLEAGYISNIEEERLLKSSSFQKKLARAVALSATEYLSSIASRIPADNKTDQQSKKTAAQTEMPTEQYKVKSGDTLFSIARRFNTTLSVLLKLNSRKIDDPLLAHQKIIVPAAKTAQEDASGLNTAEEKEKPESGSKEAKIYTVRQGDTLFSLAKNHSLSVDELRKLNNMKNSDILLSGQKIKLPSK